MKIEQGLLARFMLKLNYWNLNNEKKKITQVLKEPNILLSYDF